jgi:hypothetical protein
LSFCVEANDVGVQEINMTKSYINRSGVHNVATAKKRKAYIIDESKEDEVED